MECVPIMYSVSLQAFSWSSVSVVCVIFLFSDINWLHGLTKINPPSSILCVWEFGCVRKADRRERFSNLKGQVSLCNTCLTSACVLDQVPGKQGSKELRLEGTKPYWLSWWLVASFIRLVG